MTPHVRLCWSVSLSVRLSYFNLYKGGKLHFHGPIGVVVQLCVVARQALLIGVEGIEVESGQLGDDGSVREGRGQPVHGRTPCLTRRRIL